MQRDLNVMMTAYVRGTNWVQVFKVLHTLALVENKGHSEWRLTGKQFYLIMKIF